LRSERAETPVQGRATGSIASARRLNTLIHGIYEPLRVASYLKRASDTTYSIASR